MTKKWKITLMAIAGVLAIGTGVGIAAARGASDRANIQPGYYAANDNSNFANENINQWYCGGAGPMTGYLTPQVTTLLGTTASDLQSQLSSGKTLADIAAAKGVSQDQLIQTMLGPYTDHLAIMVKYSYLTQTQADTAAQQAKTRLQTVITGQINPGVGNWNGMGGMMRGLTGTSNSGTDLAPGTGYGMMGGYGGGMMRGR